MENIKTIILGSEAIDDEEKNLWLQLLEHMSEEQQHKLSSVLIWEKTELAKARMRYEAKKIGLS